MAWHFATAPCKHFSLVSFFRLGQTITLVVDGTEYENRVSGDFFEMDTDQRLYIGIVVSVCLFLSDITYSVYEKTVEKKPYLYKHLITNVQVHCIR